LATKDELCLYLIDVTGCGVRAALHSCAILHTIHSAIEQHGRLAREPDAFAETLNREFLMEEHDNTFFTFWYGLYNKKAKTLSYISCGAPPAILCPEGKLLQSDNMPLGIDKKTQFKSSSTAIPEKSSLFLCSDGVYEIEHDDGKVGSFEEFARAALAPSQPGMSEPDRILNWSRKMAQGKPFADDFCLIHVQF